MCLCVCDLLSPVVMQMVGVLPRYLQRPLCFVDFLEHCWSRLDLDSSWKVDFVLHLGVDLSAGLESQIKKGSQLPFLSAFD